MLQDRLPACLSNEDKRPITRDAGSVPPLDNNARPTCSPHEMRLISHLQRRLIQRSCRHIQCGRELLSPIHSHPEYHTRTTLGSHRGTSQSHAPHCQPSPNVLGVCSYDRVLPQQSHISQKYQRDPAHLGQRTYARPEPFTHLRLPSVRPQPAAPAPQDGIHSLQGHSCGIPHRYIRVSCLQPAHPKGHHHQTRQIRRNFRWAPE